MNPKNTWTWLVVAAGLFGFIFFFERHLHSPDLSPVAVLPNLKGSAVTGIQMRPAGQLEVRAERTNSSWQLTKPIVYPARAAAIESLLAALERLTPATYFSAHELRQRPKTDEEFGFDTPQVALIIQQNDQRVQILIGARTAPGDQVYLQVVGVEGVYVVDARLLKLIPQTAADWRDSTLVDLRGLKFDRLSVTNRAKIFVELQRDGSNNLWRMTWPLHARADSDRIAEALQKLQEARVTQFVSDDPKADLETYGLQPADLDLALGQGTNVVTLLSFGRNPTNDVSQVYAQRRGLKTIVTVPSELPATWRDASINDFRDAHLVALTAPVDEVEIRGEDNFILQRQGTNAWRIPSQPFPVDAGLVNETLDTLAMMQIVQFDKAVVTEPDLPKYGLAAPTLQIILRSALTNDTETTNLVIAHLFFGTNRDDKIFVRRADEDSIYAVKLADFQRLPSVSWQLRDRRIWNFTENDVARLTIRQGGRARQLVHNGTNSWSLAPGSQGIINEFAIEEAVHRLGELGASAWVAHGPAARDERYGLKDANHQISVELKSGEKLDVEFGGESPSRYPYAAVMLGGQLWVFEFPLALRQFVQSYLTIPADIP